MHLPRPLRTSPPLWSTVILPARNDKQFEERARSLISGRIFLHRSAELDWRGTVQTAVQLITFTSVFWQSDDGQFQGKTDNRQLVMPRWWRFPPSPLHPFSSRSVLAHLLHFLLWITEHSLRSLCLPMHSGGPNQLNVSGRYWATRRRRCLALSLIAIAGFSPWQRHRIIPLKAARQITNLARLSGAKPHTFKGSAGKMRKFGRGVEMPPQSGVWSRKKKKHAHFFPTDRSRQSEVKAVMSFLPLTMKGKHLCWLSCFVMPKPLISELMQLSRWNKAHSN